MKDIEQLYTLWDEFLKEWPAQRLRTMTRDEYTQAGSKDTFTYWLEWRLRDLGSIRGRGASKFGIFSRANDDPKKVMAGCAIAIRMPGIRLWAQRLKKLLKRCAIT